MELNHCYKKVRQRLLFSAVLFFGILLSHEARSQDTLVPQELRSPNVKRALTKNPQTLANALIEGKTSEKEKFDALFAWVVNNISYDYRLYNSGKGNRANNPLKRVLRRKKGVCTDYARLMDTLCAAVGIENTTIEGYTKEIVFDLNDTLYFDNHAWNAVKLSGSWYLYDATWSSGSAVYDYTRFGKWRLRQIEKLEKRVKTRPMILFINGGKSKFCGDKQKRKLKTVQVLRLPLIPAILSGILSAFPFRIKERHRYVLNTNYYLTQPEVFAINHFPNNPVWSLQDDLKTVADFSADSAYYYRTESIYNNQQRGGRTCVKCEEIHFRDEIGKEKYLISTSFQNNPKNHLLPANANLAIAEIFLNRFYKENDSLQKMALFDSTNYYIERSKNELRQSRKDNGKNLRFQSKKNRTKKALLLRDNKKHWSVISSELKETRRKMSKFRSLNKKAKSYIKRGKRDFGTFNRAFSNKRVSKPLKKEQEERIRIKLLEYMAESDSLSSQIEQLQDSLDIHVPNLWANLVEEINIFAPLLSLIWQDSWHRCVNLSDQYDRRIREIRNEIDTQEVLIQSRIDTKILQLSDKTYEEFMQMNRLIKKRNLLDVKAAKQVKLLYMGGAMKLDSVTILKSQRGEHIKKDVCWNHDNKGLINALVDNFEAFDRQNRNFGRGLRNNDKLERFRARIFDGHNKRNAKRVTNVIKSNSSVALQLKKELYEHRNAFLKKLRKERQKK